MLCFPEADLVREAYVRGPGPMQRSAEKRLGGQSAFGKDVGSASGAGLSGGRGHLHFGWICRLGPLWRTDPTWRAEARGKSTPGADRNSARATGEDTRNVQMPEKL